MGMNTFLGIFEFAMNEHMINFNPKYWFYRLYWWIMGGASVMLPMRHLTMVVDHNHPLWWDCGGAMFVEVHTSDPVFIYGPWLKENVGQINKDWHIILHVDNNVTQVEIQFRRGLEQYANLASLTWT